LGAVRNTSIPIDAMLTSSSLSAFRIWFATCVVLFAGVTASVAIAQSKAETEEAIDAGTQVTLAEAALTESSGLCFSRIDPHCVWTHNDSGDGPRLFAFDCRSGAQSGQCRLSVSKAVDWEDMAAFTDEGVPRLLVADCGDNRSQRSSVRMYLFDEPRPDTDSTVQQLTTIEMKYADGPHDCEAVAVDVSRRQIVMVAKGRLPFAGVYVLPLPKRSETARTITQMAKRVATLAMPMITAMDLNVSNGDLWLCNYWAAFHYPKTSPDVSLAKQLSKPADPIPLPRWKQIEALALDDEQRVWITTEGTALLGRLKIPNGASQ
ncbi:MAG: hypothetical protein AAGA03_11860, partial [Planctomycetota bacterium]